MRALVTGGAGFLGSHLCDKLIEKNYEVICVDNLLTGNRENISHLLDNPNFKFVEADASLPLSIFEKLDFVYHMASPASPNVNSEKSYQSLPFETMQINSQGTWHLAKLALKNSARFLFASTSEIYGDPLEHPQKESYRGNVSTTGPRSVYDEAKRFGETVTSAYTKHKSLDGRIIRIFNTYGPRMDQDGRVVIEFVKAALEGKPLSVFGDGRQTRSFCFVSDLVEGIVLAMEKGEKGEVYNLGNPNEFTIAEFAEVVKMVTGSGSEIEFKEELPEDEPKRRCPDISKAQEKLGFEPKIQVEDGIQKLVSYLRVKG